ncbi:MAG: hypothetical protein WBG38_14625 [Nodosilinea sp.]
MHSLIMLAPLATGCDRTTSPHDPIFRYTVDGERLYQYSRSLSRSTRAVATQSSKILALPEGASNTNRQLTPQISEADCEAKVMVP